MATIEELKKIKFDSEGRAFQAKFAIENIELLKLLSNKEVYISVTIRIVLTLGETEEPRGDPMFSCSYFPEVVAPVIDRSL